jgi:hypothetical protein
VTTPIPGSISVSDWTAEEWTAHTRWIAELGCSMADALAGTAQHARAAAASLSDLTAAQQAEERP